MAGTSQLGPRKAATENCAWVHDLSRGAMVSKRGSFDGFSDGFLQCRRSNFVVVTFRSLLFDSREELGLSRLLQEAVLSARYGFAPFQAPVALLPITQHIHVIDPFTWSYGR